MKKFMRNFTASLLAISLLAGCSSGAAPAKEAPAAPAEPAKEAPAEPAKEAAPAAPAPASGGKLVVYSPNTEDMVNAIIPLFEKETGITVDIISAGTGELWKRIESEKDNANADIMWGGARSTAVNNVDLLEEYVSPNDAELPEQYRNYGGKISFYCLDGSNLLVNKDLIGDIKIKGYKDLLNPELKGKIIMGDPAASSSAYAQLTNMLLAVGGDYESDAGWDYVKALLEITGGKVASSSSVVHKSVADGEYVVALTYEDPSASYVKAGAPVEVVYMEEGAVFLPASVSIIKGSKNKENAQKFIDFIISKQAQDVFGTQLTARPVRPDAQLGDYWVPMSAINQIFEDNDYVQQNKTKIVDRYKDILMSIG